ncbi:glutamate 5-kinase, partial [Dietzia sp. CW19]|nr:glutamate 5-kinase [Dietzia sp. CW19]
MTDEPELRRRIGTARRVVVKIGSSAITSFGGGIRRPQLDALADVCQARMAAGSDVFVVSSGAIGAGMSPLGMTTRPATLSAKQAAASVGQLELARAWGDSFSRYDRVVGQVLLTAGDIGRRESAANAQRTLDRLRTLGAVPVINENDTVATNEIRFGDNDRLAALVAHLTSADALILLSDVDALYDSDPRKGDATAVTMVSGAADLDGVVAGAGGALGTGGMASKLAAARLA